MDQFEWGWIFGLEESPAWRRDVLFISFEANRSLVHMASQLKMH